MKQIINISLVIIALVSILILIGASTVKLERSGCDKAYVEIFRENENGFVDKEEIITKLHLADSSLAKKNVNQYKNRHN